MLLLVFALSASGITWEGQTSSTDRALLFAKVFEDKKLASRGRYDADRFVLSDDAVAGRHSISYHFPKGKLTPSDSSAVRPGRSRSDAMMEYKGYDGKVEFDDEARIFHGEVIDTRDVITFQERSVDELKTAFQDSIDDYLAFCKQRGEEPNKPFSGQFVTRIPPELHRQVNLAARISGKSLNAWVAEQLQAAVARFKSMKAAKDTGKRKRKPQRAEKHA